MRTAFLFLVLSLFHACEPQSTFLSVSQNFCSTLSGGILVDNLSCPEEEIEFGNCFLRSSLCDGVGDCNDGGVGSDEGDDNLFSSLECEWVHAHCKTMA